MKKFFIILVLLILSLQKCFSQEENTYNKNDFGMTVGLTDYQVRDKVLNNIRHRGIFPSLGFSYEWIRAVKRQRIELYLIFNMLKSRYDPDHNTFIINPSLNYSYVRKVKEINPKIDLLIGGITGLHSHQAYFGNWDDSHIYWLTYYYIGFDGVLTYQKSQKSSFYFEIEIPILALVSRPPERFLYKIMDDKFSWIVHEIHTNLKFTSIHQHFVLNMNLGYDFSYSDKFQQRVYWRFSYINNSISYSKNISILTHTLGATFLF